MINSGIYCIINQVNCKIYIGSSCNLKSRFQEHLKTLKSQRHCNRHLQRAYNKYGKDVFVFTILEEVHGKASLINREQYWLDNSKSYDKSFGYNICKQAYNSLGHKWTEEQKANKRGHIVTKETRDKIGAANKGRPCPEHLKEFFRKQNTGRDITWGAKISKIKRGQPSKLRGKFLVSRETRICVCGCSKEFQSKVNSKQKFLHGHNRRKEPVWITR